MVLVLLCIFVGLPNKNPFSFGEYYLFFRLPEQMQFCLNYMALKSLQHSLWWCPVCFLPMHVLARFGLSQKTSKR